MAFGMVKDESRVRIAHVIEGNVAMEIRVK
jgi:hypothetical protein